MPPAENIAQRKTPKQLLNKTKLLVKEQKQALTT